jgi:diacylglycerol kinase (ATP)
MQRIIRACQNSWNGLMAATRGEAAFRQELVVLALAVPLAFVLASEPWKRLALVGAVLFVMVVELLNTAIEKLADCITLELDPRIGAIKDMGSAAVGLSLFIAGLTWLAAFVEWAAR